ncbi:general transcription factor II-I repeat domain-containing protein 2-like [Schistocerca serialis cubense]|uniref:general transcription factor II-I repeat domain-containing protein 2-like n=1 Tax=Schistocerca serialis cubense TaxID=2023355 RepID=UPI00214EA702|nr:general transcription factor II-I repeat domain-containing protein 2-like [Schistocerca serialis cubense]
MDSLVQLINFMSLILLFNMESSRSFFQNVMQRQVVERFWLIKEEVTSFLQILDTHRAKKHLEFITNEHNMLDMAFLKDILKYLNALYIELQGNGKLVCDLTQKYKKENSVEDIAVFVRFLSNLWDEFATRFQDCKNWKLSQFLKFPYEVDASAEWTDVAAKLFSVSKSSLQVEIIDLQEDISLQMYKTVSTEEFWGKHVSEKYQNFKKVAINLATMFGLTYICESSFSKMNFSRNTYKSRSTDAHLEDILCICCTPRTPNFKKLAQDCRCNFSH